MTPVEKHITLNSPLELQQGDRIVRVADDNEVEHPILVDNYPYEDGDKIKVGLAGLNVVWMRESDRVIVLRQVDEPAYEVGSVAKVGEQVYVRGEERWAPIRNTGHLGAYCVSDESIASDDREGLVTFILGGAQ